MATCAAMRCDVLSEVEASGNRSERSRSTLFQCLKSVPGFKGMYAYWFKDLPKPVVPAGLSVHQLSVHHLHRYICIALKYATIVTRMYIFKT